MTVKSASFAIVVGALSAVLLAIPLSLSHSLLAGLVQKTALADFFADHSISGPRIMLWSWQHKDDLSYLDISRVGVAYLAGRFVICHDRVSFEPNLAQIKLPAGIYREAAVRLEVSSFADENQETLADQLSGGIVSRVLDSSKPISALQIDFDARQNERKFYVSVLRKIRAKLPSEIKLSITALASWCLGDNWLSANHLPVDEVVPMLFSLGLGQHDTVSRLNSAKTLSPKSFGGRLAPGLSLHEPKIFTLLGERLSQYRRIYIFSPKGWNYSNYVRAQKLLNSQEIDNSKISEAIK